MFGWANIHSPTCDVTKARAMLVVDLQEAMIGEGDRSQVPYLIGALIEYDHGGDEEAEICNCDFMKRMSHLEWCELRVLSQKAMEVLMANQASAGMVDMVNGAYAVANAVIEHRFGNHDRRAYPDGMHG